LEKLSDIFDPETANDYVCPKTNDIRQPLSLEELRRRMYIKQTKLVLILDFKNQILALLYLNQTYFTIVDVIKVKKHFKY
jgi:hypothetical protein